MPSHAQRLVHAIRTRNHERVRELIRAHGDVNACTAAGRTALHAAAEEGDGTAAAIVLQAGADVNARMAYGRTPLHLAASHGGGWDLADADLDRRDACANPKPIDPAVAEVLLDIFKTAEPSIPAELTAFDRIDGAGKMDVLAAALRSFAEPARLCRRNPVFHPGMR